MGRTRRSYLPGVVFHLTSRTQGHQPWFTPEVRTRIAEITASSVVRTDGRLLAFAIMPNHLHLVFRQGNAPLGHLMQPLLCRVARLVHRFHGTEGHVFERRFRDRPCLDPEHLRNAIVYTHLNPVRAGLVDRASAYPWSSHGLYLADGGEPVCMRRVLMVEGALSHFMPWEGAGLAELRQAYACYLDWRIARDRYQAADELGNATGLPPVPPPVAAGDVWWTRNHIQLDQRSLEFPDGVAFGRRTASADLSEIAKRTLAEFAPQMTLDQLRSPSKARAIVRLRRTVVQRMSAAGHRGGAIARYLRVGDQCVSNILAAARANATRTIP